MLKSIFLGLTVLASLSNAKIEVGNNCYGSTREGYTCTLFCKADNLDENSQSVALQKSLTYYAYDIRRSFNFTDIYTTKNGFTAEIRNTNRYDHSNSTNGQETKIDIEFKDAAAGDAGRFRCQRRRKSDGLFIEESRTDLLRIIVPKDEITTKLHFGLRKAGTTGKTLEIEKTFENNEKVNLTKSDYENLVYIINMTWIIPEEDPSIKLELTESNGDKYPFRFTMRYHTTTTQPEDKKLVPDNPVDVLYFYKPEWACAGYMQIHGSYIQYIAYKREEYKAESQLEIATDCVNFAYRTSFSLPMIVGALLILLNFVGTV